MVIFGIMRCLLSFITCCIILCPTAIYAQDGLPFMTDVELPRQYNNSRISSVAQNEEEVMLFATSRGLLKYDGSEWSRIATPSPVLRVVYHAPSQRVFLGLRNGAAEVVKSDSGAYIIRPIPGIASREAMPHIYATSSHVFFIGDSEIHQFEPQQNQPAESVQFDERFITGAFIHANTLHLLFYQEGLYSWTDKKLVEQVGHQSISEDVMLFSFETANGTFIGFENDALYRFDGKYFRPVKKKLQQFLSNNILSDGLLLNDSLMALSTLAGGAVIVQVPSYKIVHRFNYTTGTKDNEVFCLGKDSDNGLWFAYDDGLSRVDLSQPIKNYTGYPGLTGNLTASLMNNETLYVGTGNGVFILQEATNRAEIDRMMQEIIRKQNEAKKQRSEEKETTTEAPSVATQEESPRNETEQQTLIARFKENPSEVRKELSRKEIRDLKREIRRQEKKNRKKKSAGETIEDFFSGSKNNEEPEEDEEAEPISGNTANNTELSSSNAQNTDIDKPSGTTTNTPLGTASANKKSVARQAKAASSKSFLFKKIDGVDVKCRQLIQINNQVFAATNNGLYQLNGLKSKNLTPGLYINHVVCSADKSKLFIASVSGVQTVSKAANGKWKSEPLNDTLTHVAYNVTQANNGDVWAGSDNGAYRYTAQGIKRYTIPEVMNERILVANINNTIHFLLPSAIFKYEALADTILPTSLPEIPTTTRLEYVLTNDATIWVKSELNWHIINGEKYASLLPFLDLFEDIRNLSTDDKGNVYVIDNGNRLYSVQPRDHELSYKFNIYIRQVKDANGQPFSLQGTKIETASGALIFNVSAPFYLKSNGTKFQYRIEGHRDNWSRWSTDKEIDPGNFAPGNYVLQVRAKNILGEISEIKTFEFSVPRPLFLRWYFLVLYVLMLAALVLVIIKVRERNLRETQRILEEKVAQRTAELESEKVKTEELLLNILPKDTAQELQRHGKATARHYNQVSVLFTDFKGFTQFAENTKPEDLVNELHRCFVGFDEIIGKYHLEKIKTIGDAYMCAGGVPIRNNSNAIAITLAALEIRDFMQKIAKEKQEKNQPILEIRIGIHTGPLTAGVVGLKKFAYDIWGDTVNTASRMESSSEPGKVNVSGHTYQLIKKYFECEFRGKKEVKGKGLVEMYFVSAIKPEFSVNGDGITPNKGLWEIIN